jgi:hypothetical protein
MKLIYICVYIYICTIVRIQSFNIKVDTTSGCHSASLQWILDGEEYPGALGEHAWFQIDRVFSIFPKSALKQTFTCEGNVLIQGRI